MTKGKEILISWDEEDRMRIIWSNALPPDMANAACELQRLYTNNKNLLDTLHKESMR